MKYWIFMLACCQMLLSCRQGEMLVESSTDFDRNSGAIRKVVSINPEFQLLTSKLSGSERIEHSTIMQAEFINYLQVNAEKFDIELVVYDPSIKDNPSQDYFNDLLPLKEAVMQNMRLQDVKTERHPKKKYGKHPPSLQFQEIFQLPTRFGLLSQKYGTPYFAIHGLISAEAKRGQMLYYTIWLNVESSEIVYREIRVLKNKSRSIILNTILYDSFHIIKNS